MQRQRLEQSEIEGLLGDWPGWAYDLVLELRELVLNVAPELAETVAYKSLYYYKPGQPYGVIGGNVCLIGVRGDCVHLAFLHGAFLPDPDGLLQGTGKAKRHIELRSKENMRRGPLEMLIRAAIAHQPNVR